MIADLPTRAAFLANRSSIVSPSRISARFLTVDIPAWSESLTLRHFPTVCIQYAHEHEGAFAETHSSRGEFLQGLLNFHSVAQIGVRNCSAIMDLK